MRSTIAALLALFIFSTPVFGQRNSFINPVVSPLHFNAGFAGSLDHSRVALAYRNQWMAIPGSYQTVYASYDQVSNRLKGAFGGEIYHEGHGEGNRDFRVSGMYAMKINLGSSWTLSPALKVGFRNYQIDGWGVDVVGNSGSATVRRNEVTFHPGILLNSPAFYFGLSSGFLAGIPLDENQSRPEWAARVPRNFTIQSGYQLQPNGKTWSLAFSGVGVVAQAYTDLMGQSIFQSKRVLFGAGLGLSRQDGSFSRVSALVTGGYRHRLFRVMAVYDYSFSSLSNSISGGSFDLSLMVYLPRKKASASPESSGM